MYPLLPTYKFFLDTLDNTFLYMFIYVQNFFFYIFPVYGPARKKSGKYCLRGCKNQ
jgi:hypothetical protein